MIFSSKYFFCNNEQICKVQTTVRLFYRSNSRAFLIFRDVTAKYNLLIWVHFKLTRLSRCFKFSLYKFNNVTPLAIHLSHP